jgi:hypothetical protein
VKANVLLQGDIGTGKTRSLITLLPEYIDERGKAQRGAGLEVFLVSMEPGVEASLGPNLCGTPNAPTPAIHVHYHPPAAVDWAVMRKWAAVMHVSSIEQAIKTVDPGRASYTQFLDLFDICSAFTCDKCGVDFGDVGEWDDSRAIALDGLTGLTKMAQFSTVGSRPFLSLPEYGGIQGLIEGFMDLAWSGTKCTSILLAHIEREVSPLTGLSTLTTLTLGQKLAPKLAKKPDEIIVSDFLEDKYVWNTAELGRGLKRRRLPLSTSLTPDFSQLFR